MSLRYVAVLPVPFNHAAFRAEMVLTMSRLMGGMLEDFGRTYHNWDQPPSFEFEFKNEDKLIEAHVFCDALRDGDRVKGTTSPNPAPPNLVYYMLNHGTVVRYATMTGDPLFNAKTRPKWLGSGQGDGGMVYVSKFVPRPGITAREWDVAVKEKYEKIIVSQLRSSLIRGVAASGHAYVK